jgi:hypothetical protein
MITEYEVGQRHRSAEPSTFIATKVPYLGDDAKQAGGPGDLMSTRSQY